MIILEILIMNLPSQPGSRKKGCLVMIIQRIFSFSDPNWLLFLKSRFQSHFGLCGDQFIRVFPHDRSTRRKWKKRRIWQSHSHVCRKTWQCIRPRWRTHVKRWLLMAFGVPGGVGLLWRIADEVAALRCAEKYDVLGMHSTLEFSFVLMVLCWAESVRIGRRYSENLLFTYHFFFQLICQ